MVEQIGKLKEEYNHVEYLQNEITSYFQDLPFVLALKNKDVEALGAKLGVAGRIDWMNLVIGHGAIRTASNAGKTPQEIEVLLSDMAKMLKTVLDNLPLEKLQKMLYFCKCAKYTLDKINAEIKEFQLNGLPFIVNFNKASSEGFLLKDYRTSSRPAGVDRATPSAQVKLSFQMPKPEELQQHLQTKKRKEEEEVPAAAAAPPVAAPPAAQAVDELNKIYVMNANSLDYKQVFESVITLRMGSCPVSFLCESVNSSDYYVQMKLYKLKTRKFIPNKMDDGDTCDTVDFIEEPMITMNFVGNEVDDGEVYRCARKMCQDAIRTIEKRNEILENINK